MHIKFYSSVVRVVSGMTAALIVFGAVACTEKKVDVNLRIEVKTNQGDVIADAAVKVDGELVGQSDAKGELQVKMSLPAKSRKKIEVTKQSDKYYFAPFFESFVVAETTQDLPVTATLFFVPKPEAESQEVAAPSDEAAAASPSSNAAEAVSEQGAKAAQLESDRDESTGVVSDAAAEGPYPKPHRATKGPLVFTIHVYEAPATTTAPEKPLADTAVFMGLDNAGDLKLVCKTNARGRCVVKFPSRPEGSVSFVARKTGFLTRGDSAEIEEDGSLRLVLSRGETIDIFATTRTYNYLKGLPGVEVTIKGKSAGMTDAFGRLSYGFSGKHNDLLSVGLKSSDYLPESFETDFVVSGPMTLVRYFAPREAPAVKVTLLKAQPGSNLSANDLAAFDGVMDQEIRAAAKRVFFASPSFIEYPVNEFGRSLRAVDITLNQAIKKGWMTTDLKAAVDAVILPSISMQDRPQLELNLIDSKGMVLAAAREKLDNLKDAAAIQRSMEVLATKIIKAFPFEGAVIGKDSKFVTINIGSASGRGLAVGDQAEIHGIQADARGKNQVQKRIAVVRVVDIFAQSARCEVKTLEPRAVISRGDLVVLRPRNKGPSLSSSVKATTKEGGATKPVAQANVYVDDVWVGATDDSGRMRIDPAGVQGKGQVLVSKLGYKPFTAEVNFEKPKHLDVQLKRDVAYVRVDSRPPGATVEFDGVASGNTPLNAPVSVNSGFTKLRIKGPSGYKIYEAVLDLDEGTLDLTGSNAVVLELDFIAQAKKIAVSQPEQALIKLAEIPADHSDFLLGRHVAGELYLLRLQDAPKAAEAFGEVTRSSAVAEFTDKRFIGSHVNEGIALFLVGERLKANSAEAAAAHYRKAVEVLDRVGPQLRFVPAGEHDQAVHNVDYYRALARHRLWSLNKDGVALAEAYRAWRDYVEGSVKSVPLNKSTKPLAENARVYYRQIQSSMMSQSQ